MPLQASGETAVEKVGFHLCGSMLRNFSHIKVQMLWFACDLKEDCSIIAFVQEDGILYDTFGFYVLLQVQTLDLHVSCVQSFKIFEFISHIYQACAVNLYLSAVKIAGVDFLCSLSYYEFGRVDAGSSEVFGDVCDPHLDVGDGGGIGYFAFHSTGGRS